MATKKTAALLSSLVATKGHVPTTTNAPPRSAAISVEEAVNNVPLNFRVSGEFRRRFRMYAAAHDLKLSELLRLAFNEYEQSQGN